MKSAGGSSHEDEKKRHMPGLAQDDWVPERGRDHRTKIFRRQKRISRIDLGPLTRTLPLYRCDENGKRQVVLIVRDRNGNSVPAVFKAESHAAAFILARVSTGTKLNADEAGSRDSLHANFEVPRINHDEAYSLEGARTNMAESYFSRLCRSEIGLHHHVAGACLVRYAQEAGWREDNRRVSNGELV
jgi:hypothetical protein